MKLKTPKKQSAAIASVKAMEIVSFDKPILGDIFRFIRIFRFFGSILLHLRKLLRKSIYNIIHFPKIFAPQNRTQKRVCA